MNKLKSIDFKQFFIDHGEKLGFGVAVLLAIGVLGMANWQTYDKAPEAFRSKADQASQALARSQWPETERTEAFALVDFTAQKEQRLASLSEDGFHYVVEMSPKLYPREAQFKEIKLFAVEELIVHNGRTAIFTHPPESATSDTESPTVASGKTEEKKPAPDASSEFLVRQPMRNNEFAPMGADAAYVPPADSGYIPPPDLAMHGAMDPAAMAAMIPADGLMYTMDAASNRHGRGLRYNSVVGVVPHKKMMEAYKQALHLISPEMAAQRIQYVDFRIERQKQLPQDDQWTEWQTLDLEPVIASITKEWEYWDEEVVKVTVTNPVFTMPLPPRAMGSWQFHGSHPRMREYLLSEEQKEEERKKNELAFLEAQKKKSRSTGGFAGISLDLSAARRQIDMMAGPAMADMAAMPGMHAAAVPGISMSAGPAMMPMPPSFDPAMHSSSAMPMPGMDGMMPADGMSMVSFGPPNTSDLLLFRFIDTEIEPGRTYRYRVQLTVRNPSFGMPVEQLEKPEIAQGETRDTPWSEPSKPVTVEDDVKYFVNRIPRRNGRPANEVHMDVIQWDTALGTLEQGRNQPMVVGQHIGGSVRGERLDVIKEKIEEKVQVVMFGQDMLVDAIGGPVAVAAEHPDLKLSQRELSGILDSGLLDEVMTVDPDGILELQTHYDDRDAAASENNRYAQQMQAFEHLRGKEEAAQEAVAASSLDMYAAEYGLAPGPKNKKDKNKKRVNLANPMMMMMNSSASGMHGAAAPQPAPKKGKKR